MGNKGGSRQAGKGSKPRNVGTRQWYEGYESIRQFKGNRKVKNERIVYPRTKAS